MAVLVPFIYSDAALARITGERGILKKGEPIFRHWSKDNGRTRTSPGMQIEGPARPGTSSALIICIM